MIDFLVYTSVGIVHGPSDVYFITEQSGITKWAGTYLHIQMQATSAVYRKNNPKDVATRKIGDAEGAALWATEQMSSLARKWILL